MLQSYNPRKEEGETMPHSQYTNEEVARMADEIYRRDIRPKVMPHHKGKFLILDIESGDYEIDEDDLSAEEMLRARRPEGVFFGIRIGYKTAYKLGGTMEEDAP
jgi:hypothetical protein